MPGRGVLLGHGMSRFEVRAGHPNSIGARKRPLHHMCPTVVVRDGRPMLALGAAGGRTIPNAVFNVLTHHLLLKQPVEAALKAPRLHTEGTLDISLEGTWPAEPRALLEKFGYTIATSLRTGLASAVWRDAATGELRKASR